MRVTAVGNGAMGMVVLVVDIEVGESKMHSLNLFIHSITLILLLSTTTVNIYSGADGITNIKIQVSPIAYVLIAILLIYHIFKLIKKGFNNNQ